MPSTVTRTRLACRSTSAVTGFFRSGSVIRKKALFSRISARPRGPTRTRPSTGPWRSWRRRARSATGTGMSGWCDRVGGTAGCRPNAGTEPGRPPVRGRGAQWLDAAHPTRGPKTPRRAALRARPERQSRASFRLPAELKLRPTSAGAGRQAFRPSRSRPYLPCGHRLAPVLVIEVPAHGGGQARNRTCGPALKPSSRAIFEASMA